MKAQTGSLLISVMFPGRLLFSEVERELHQLLDLHSYAVTTVYGCDMASDLRTVRDSLSQHLETSTHKLFKMNRSCRSFTVIHAFPYSGHTKANMTLELILWLWQSVFYDMINQGIADLQRTGFCDWEIICLNRSAFKHKLNTKHIFI